MPEEVRGGLWGLFHGHSSTPALPLPKPGYVEPYIPDEPTFIMSAAVWREYYKTGGKSDPANHGQEIFTPTNEWYYGPPPEVAAKFQPQHDKAPIP